MNLRRLGILSSIILASGLAASTSYAGNPTTADCLAADQDAVRLHNAHKLRAARQQLLVCASDTCPADIRSDCAARAADVSKAIPTIVFEVKDAGGNDLTAVKIAMDGELLVDRIEGTAISLDPGEHTFTFEAAGQPKVEKKLVVEEGVTERHVEVTLGEPAAAQPSATTPSAAPQASTPQASAPVVPSPSDAAPAPAPPIADDRAAGGWSTQRWMALGLAGVGLVGIVVGSIEGLSASSSWNNSKNECSASNCPASSRPQAISDHDSATNAATVSTVSFAIGGAALVGGLLWFMLAPASNANRERSAAPAVAVDVLPSVGPGGGGMTLRGSF